MIEIEIIPESLQLIKMTDEEYFSEKYKDYVSNSRLGHLDPDNDGSIEKYLAGFVEKFSESFELGSAIHCSVLQPDEYVISKYNKPTGKLGVFVDNVFKLRNEGYTIHSAIEKAKVDSDYYANSLSEKRLKTAIKSSLEYYLNRVKKDEYYPGKKIIYISAPMNEKFNLILESLNKNKRILKKLNPETIIIPAESFNEYAILCEIKVTLDGEEIIIKVKAKLDNFTINHETKEITLNDLKTTGKYVKYFMEETGSFYIYKYYRQMGMYLWLLNAYLKHTYNYKYKLATNMLLVETIPNFDTKICKVNGGHINRGLADFKKLITILAEWLIQQQKN